MLPDKYALPKKRIFGHVTSLISENVIAAYSEKFPRVLHTPPKYKKNPPYGCEAIEKRKCGSSGVTSPIYKQASHEGCLIMLPLTCQK